KERHDRDFQLFEENENLFIWPQINKIFLKKMGLNSYCKTAR
uniref:Uncharacterized protein n=1 Tax=Mustela putorius furo TaxID=9669 RepID=M3Y253_MUSPF